MGKTTKKTEARLFGTGLLNMPKVPQDLRALEREFIQPPFSVLDTTKGPWVRRRNRRISIGIQPEVGRSETKLFGVHGHKSWMGQMMEAGFQAVSVFDSVLCELMYGWYTAPGAMILDPFAGGSVRGVVAGVMGREYCGIELREEQVESNRQQAKEIFGTVPIEISTSSMHRKFTPCGIGHDRSCGWGCCGRPFETSICVDWREMFAIMRHHRCPPDMVENGYLKYDPATGECPFMITENKGCKIQSKKFLPCHGDPITLSKGNKLVNRHRYYRIKGCYGGTNPVPAYKAHYWSLVNLFGQEEADRIVALLEKGEEHIVAQMPRENHAIVKNTNAQRHDDPKAEPYPFWAQGDSKELLPYAPKCDFLFTCPPYGPLERYSDDPADLSNMDLKTFWNAYQGIIEQACERLKENRFAAIVVGEFRDKDGWVVNFVPRTKRAFQRCGVKLYNDAILLNTVGSGSARAKHTFVHGKLVRRHQNALIFCKGDWRKASAWARGEEE